MQTSQCQILSVNSIELFGATNDKDGWTMKTNIEIQELFKQPDIVVTVKKGRITWAGHCPTNRNVAGSIPDGVTGIFH
jgi:hypothetical protein